MSEDDDLAVFRYNWGMWGISAIDPGWCERWLRRYLYGLDDVDRDFYLDTIGGE